MAYGETQITFDDLSITCTVGGVNWSLAEIAGRATIEFTRDADWSISDIEIKADRKIGPSKYATDFIDALKYAPALYDMIDRALCEDRADEIQQAVNREFEGMGFVMRADPESGDRYFYRMLRAAAE